MQMDEDIMRAAAVARRLRPVMRLDDAGSTNRVY